jgi:hypothetical protein
MTTGDVEDAGTSAQVSMQIYGDKGNSGIVPLGDGDGETFQRGHIDEFEVCSRSSSACILLWQKITFKMCASQGLRVFSILPLQVGNGRPEHHSAKTKPPL